MSHRKDSVQHLEVSSVWASRGSSVPASWPSGEQGWQYSPSERLGRRGLSSWRRGARKPCNIYEASRTLSISLIKYYKSTLFGVDCPPREGIQCPSCPPLALRLIPPRSRGVSLKLKMGHTCQWTVTQLKGPLVECGSCLCPFLWNDSRSRKGQACSLPKSTWPNHLSSLPLSPPDLHQLCTWLPGSCHWLYFCLMMDLCESWLFPLSRLQSLTLKSKFWGKKYETSEPVSRPQGPTNMDKMGSTHAAHLTSFLCHGVWSKQPMIPWPLTYLSCLLFWNYV